MQIITYKVEKDWISWDIWKSKWIKINPDLYCVISITESGHTAWAEFFKKRFSMVPIENLERKYRIGYKKLRSRTENEVMIETLELIDLYKLNPGILSNY